MKEQDYLKFVPKKIDKKIKRFVDEIVFANSKYVFVRKEEGRQIGHCTSCNKEYPEYGKHNDYKECPMCGERVQIKLTRYKRSSLIDCRTLIIFQRGLRGFNGIVGRGFYVQRDYSEDYTKVKTRYKEVAIYVFGDKKSVMYNRPIQGNYTSGFDDFSKERRNLFYRTSSIFNFNINGLANPPFYIDRYSLNRAIEETDYKYIISKNIEDENLLKYISLYTRYPIIESMQKIGLETIVLNAVRGISLQNQVNLRGKTIFDVMKLNRGELKEILRSEVQVTPKLLRLYRENKKYKYKLTIMELKDIEFIMARYAWGSLWNVLKYINIKQMYRYVVNQFYKDGEKCRYKTYGDVLGIWSDYINDLIKLKIDVKKNICPKNVFDSHNNFQKQIKYLEDKRLDEAIKANLKARELMIYKDEDFIIRPAISSKEIVEEGKALHHCVGGYVNKYADGRTNILFLRKIDEEDTPFYTVEVSTDFKVLQVRGYKNKSATEYIDLFIDSYKDNVLNELRKEKVKIKVA